MRTLIRDATFPPMKQTAPLLFFLLTACAASAVLPDVPGYSERRIAAVAESEVRYEGDEEHGEYGARRLATHAEARAEEFGGMRHESCEKVGLPAGGSCEVFRSGWHEIMNGRLDSPSDDPFRDVWTVFVNKKPVFTERMYVAADGPVLERRVVQNKAAVTFRRDLRETIGEETPASEEIPVDTWYDGSFLNDRYGVDGSHGAFAYRGVLGFVGRKGDSEYVLFNGRPITPAFDAIRTSSCCMVPHTDIRVYDDGMLFFAGERGKDVYLGEVDLDAFTGADGASYRSSGISKAHR